MQVFPLRTLFLPTTLNKLNGILGDIQGSNLNKPKVLQIGFGRLFPAGILNN
jgi:hypothetical protein